MNDSTPFDTIGDEPLEARIVAWVLGEASAFEAAELERLCEERPELLVFRRRMRALHGLLTETEAAEPDDSWKLPPEKRKALDELFGEEEIVRLEPEKEIRIRRSGRRALLAIAACVTISFIGIRLLPREYESEAIIEVKPRELGMSPLADAAPRSAGASQMTPQFFATEFEKIKSRNSLSKVVDSLELVNRWQVDKETAIRMLKDSVTTENLKGTDLIALRVRNAKKEDAQDIASEVARNYKEYRDEIENRYADKKLYELNKAVRDQEDKVEERRKVLATIVRTKGIIYKGQDSFYGSSGVNDDQGAQSAQESVNQLAQEKQQLESQINSLLKYDSDQLITYAGGLNLPDNTIKSLYPQYLEKQLELSKLKTQGVGDNHPAVKAAKEQVEGIKHQLDEGVVDLRATLQAQLNMAADRLKNVEARRDDNHEESIKRGLDAQDYVDAKRDFETDQELLQQMKLKQVAETITNKLPHDSIEVHDDPQVTTRLAIPFFSRKSASSAVAANDKSASDSRSAAESLPMPAAAPPPLLASPSALADNKATTESEGASVDGMKDLASSKVSSEFRYSTEHEPKELPQATRAPAELTESGERFFSTTPDTGTASALADEKSDLAAADIAGRMTGDNAVLLPARQRRVSGAKSELADIDADSSAKSSSARDATRPIGGTTVDGIPADRGQLAWGGVTNGLRSGDQAINRNNIDAILNNPNRTDSGVVSPGKPASEPAQPEYALQLGTDGLKKSEPANGPGGGGGVGNAFGLAKLDGAEFKGKSSVDKNKGGPRESDSESNRWLSMDEAVKQPQSEITAAPAAFAEASATDFRSQIDGPVSAPAAAAPFQLEGTEAVIGNLTLETNHDSNSIDYYDSSNSADKPAAVPELQAAQDLFRHGSGFTATFGREMPADAGNQLNWSDPGLDKSSVAQPSATPDGSMQTNPALAGEQSGNVDLVRRGLYTGEGNLNLGKFDEAKAEYEKVLQEDPYNSAARRGLEKVASAKTDSYRASNDQTRAELLMQVDKAWELKVPAETESAELADSRKAALEEPNGEIATIEKKAGELEFEIHTGLTSEYAFRGLDLSKGAKAAPAKKSPLESMEEIAASEEAYSTFSLNINDASFQIAKAALEKGDRPDPAAIKVEQFYNAVDYGDPAPATNEPVAARIEQAAHPIIPGRNLVRVSLKTAAAGRGASQPLRLTLLVDQSGSMVREDRRTAMSNALKQLGGLLTPNDHITVVGFSRESHLLADNWTGDKAGKLGDLINQTASEGGTNLEQAINLGEQMAARPHPAGEQNRIVLFTDGAANLGNANPERLAERVKSLRQKGIAFDIAGIGADGVNDRLLSELARNGNGRYYVVGDTKNESFARQLAGAFRPAAENVKVQVHFNPDRVGRYKLIGFEKDRLKTEDFRNDAVDAAELAAEEAGVAIYQVETLAQGSGEIGEVSVRFRDTSKGEMVERKWTMPFESTTQSFDRATPSMQLAGLSMLAAEKLKGGPLADAIDFRQLSGSQSLVKQFYGSSPRVADMLHVVDLLK